MTAVWWLNYYPKDVSSPGMWDQHDTGQLLKRYAWYHRGAAPPPADLGIVVIAGGFHAADVDRINFDLQRFQAVLVIVTSDEQSLFPTKLLSHQNMRLWVMTPRVGKHDDGHVHHFVGEGVPPESFLSDRPERDLDWVFAGQVTHARRKQCVAALEDLLPGTNGYLHRSEGFLQGLPRDEYQRLLVRARVAPCPAGATTQDTFRVYEALEAGCIPILDRYRPDGTGDGYWDLLFGPTHPVPVIDHWAGVGDLIYKLLADFAHLQPPIQRWWHSYKQQQRTTLKQHLLDLEARSHA